MVHIPGNWFHLAFSTVAWTLNLIFFGCMCGLGAKFNILSVYVYVCACTHLCVCTCMCTCGRHSTTSGVVSVTLCC